MDNQKIQELLDKVKAVEKGEQLDLSSGEDLSVAIMNLISIEEHLFFSYGKTQNSKFLEILNEIRSMRKDLLKQIIKEYEGEVWCISKHLLATSMRLMEVGTKALGKGDSTQAKQLFQKGYQLYSLFWGLNLNLVDTKTLSEEGLESSNEVNLIDDRHENRTPEKTNLFSKLGQIVQKAVDCCRE